MDLKQLYREIVNEHNLHPNHKGDLEHACCVMDGVNPTCGDDINLQLDIDENGTIVGGSFNGSGCAVSQASTDMMLDLIIGQSKEEAKEIADLFMAMVHGEIDEEDLEKLDEAIALKDIAHMPARAKCATLAWHTLEKMLDGEKNS